MIDYEHYKSPLPEDILTAIVELEIQVFNRWNKTLSEVRIRIQQRLLPNHQVLVVVALKIAVLLILKLVTKKSKILIMIT